MGQDTVITLVISAAWIAIGVALYMRAQPNSKDSKQLLDLRAKLERQREFRGDQRPTMIEQRLNEVSAIRSLAVRGDDLTLQENEILARLEMEDDLGKYAEGPAPLSLTATQRDLLIAHTRRDAAEATANVKVLLGEVKALRSQQNELMRFVSYAMIVLVIVGWLWRLGLIPWH